MLRGIGANPDEWNQAQRSECVTRGLQDWRLSPRADGGLRYLGSVAVQGGLPLRLLVEARGGIGQVLGRVLQLAGSRATQPDLLTWVDSLQGLLPRTYRQSTIFALLADVAWSILDLKEKARLTSGANAVRQLDQAIPNWRDRFPLPIDDTQVRGLIEQLVRDVAAVRVERQTICLPVARRIESEANHGWMLQSRLDLPETLAAAPLASLFGIAPEELPRMAELTLTVAGHEQSTALRRLAGSDSYRVERRPWGVSDRLAGEEHVLRLRAANGRLWSATAAKGDAFEADLPWIFSVEDGVFLRQGSGSVPVREAWLLLPAGWSVDPQANSEATAQGQCLDRNVWRIRGQVHAQKTSEFSYRIRTGQANAGEDILVWQGERYWLDFQIPSVAFKGRPKLVEAGESGARHPVNGEPQFSAQVGPVTTRYPATGTIQHSSRLLLLPQGATLTLDCCDSRSGTIRLENWQAMHARVLAPDVHADLRRNSQAVLLHLAMRPGARTPEKVDIEVTWPQATAKLRVPFPAKGVRAFDGDGRELKPNDLLAAHRLTGVRLHVLAGDHNIGLDFSLGKYKRVHKLRPAPGALSLEIRLQDYATDIQHLLSSDDKPDAQVRVTVRPSGATSFPLCLARYAAKLDKNDTEISLDNVAVLSPEAISHLPVMALRLERPGDEAIRLEPQTSQGVATGVWEFAPATREPGSWLIYPGEEAALPFRPTLWTVKGEIHTDSPLARAIGSADQAAREAALDQTIQVMASNFLAPCWLELDRLAVQIGHLPLTTLDVWRRLARSPQGMAALALRFASLPAGFLDHVDQELPFAWETVPASAWRQAMGYLDRQCQESFGDVAGAAVFAIHLDARIKDLSASHGALAYLLGIASAPFLPSARQQARVLAHTGKQCAQQLFAGADSLSMKLRQRHANEQWPVDFNPILNGARRQANVARMLHPDALGYQDGAINLPLLLAVQAATNQTSDWFAHPENIHVLRTHRSFDPEWFDEAYNLTIARCLADGLFTV
ncbi:STY4851/ECs_5259 family protein [Accumulibacter sp.]|uniref:STY4851/ECs_5259 family protein n=1 Tax=Accumulibacter sp. TaxID=2053492 RepID=UPI002CE08B80|nr:STY4851/ECs_5259 family protein [Accumulibacter sp.]HNC21692.1 STY4851/ECs_5259 family protein [Accumulibacter sp.]